jgi:peptide/nickel transport system substrate-binding protein
VNTAEVDDPKLDEQIDKARATTDPEQAAKAWGDLDREVTEQVYFIPWLWDNNVGLRSDNVNGVSKRGPGAETPGPRCSR